MCHSSERPGPGASAGGVRPAQMRSSTASYAEISPEVILRDGVRNRAIFVRHEAYMPYDPTVPHISTCISALGSTPALIHFLLYIVRHIDQSEPIEHGKAVLKYSMALGCIAVVGVFAISRVKFRYALDASSTTKALISMLFGQMQDYFSGPRLVAQSIEARRMFKNEIGMGTIINDLFGNVPLISEALRFPDALPHCS